MQLAKGFNELQLNLEDIEQQRRLIRLRKYLRFLLVGFLIGRDSRKRMEELVAKNRQIVEELLRQLESLVNDEEYIAEFSSEYIHLAQLEVRTKSYVLPEIEFGLKSYHQALVTHVRGAIEKREQALRTQVERMVGSGTYLIYSDRRDFVNALESLRQDLSRCEQSHVLDNKYIKEKRQALEEHQTRILNYNQDFIRQRKEAYQHLWSKGFLSLDDEQQTAVVTDDKYNLVVAAAGSGKTEVLITRIAYLVARKPDGIRPHRILAIAYQNKDVKQIQARLTEQYGIAGVNVKTLHGLGIEVLESW